MFALYSVRFCRSALRRCFSSSRDSLVLVEKYKAVTVISLNRPEKQNALNQAMLNELGKALETVDADDETRAAILCGVGGNFSIGYDIEEMESVSESNEELMKCIKLPRLTSKALICCINGQCKGNAFELALLCDYRVIDAKARLRFGNRNYGIPLVNGGSRQLAKLIGGSKAAEITIFDPELSAAEAKDLGLCDCAVAEGACFGRALEKAVYITMRPPRAIQHDLNMISERVGDDVIDIVNFISADFKQGYKQSTKAAILPFPSAKSTTKFLNLDEMEDWERDEYLREIAYAEKMEKKNSDQTNGSK